MEASTTAVVDRPVGAPTARATRGGTLERWAPLSGIAFVVLFFFAFFMTNMPDANASDAKWHSYFANSGNRATLLIAGFLMVLAALCLLSFLTMLWGRAAARTPEAPHHLPLVAAGVGAACLAVGGILSATIAGAMVFGSMPEPSAGILRFADQLAFPVIAVAGMWAVALSVAGISLQAHRAGLIGSGMRTFGLVTAAFTVVSLFFFPMVVLLVWCLIVGVRLLRAGPVEAAPAR